MAFDRDLVPEIMRDAATRVILPRWRTLSADQVHAKERPDDLVTVADTEAETLITAGLLALAPGVAVIGEEAVAADPSLLDGLGTLPAYWLVDPIDGTSNFVEGTPDFGVMVAYVEGGVVAASWIWLPVTEVLASAERGQGARVDGALIEVTTEPQRADADLRGWVATKFMPPEVRARLRPESAETMSLVPPQSAAIGYTRLLQGTADASLFWRAYPWDHAPGSLMLEESGGAVLRLDGSPYLPGSTDCGLLAVHDRRTWAHLRALAMD